MRPILRPPRWRCGSLRARAGARPATVPAIGGGSRIAPRERVGGGNRPRRPRERRRGRTEQACGTVFPRRPPGRPRGRAGSPSRDRALARRSDSHPRKVTAARSPARHWQGLIQPGLVEVRSRPNRATIAWPASEIRALRRGRPDERARKRHRSRARACIGKMAGFRRGRGRRRLFGAQLDSAGMIGVSDQQRDSRRHRQPGSCHFRDCKP